MQTAYVDTSALVAIAFAEPGADQLAAELARCERLVSSTLLEAELLSAAEREGARAETAALLRPISWAHPSRRLTREIEAVLDHGYLRGADLHHLATACFVFRPPCDVVFATLDQRQADAAQALGFLLLEPDRTADAPR